MAHNLDIMTLANGRTETRYRHAKEISPWHTLGTPIADDESVDQICESIGADVDPVKVDLTIDWQGQRVIVPGYRAVVDKFGRILSVMSADYKVHSPRRMVEFFKGYFDAAEMKLVNIGFLDSGAVMWVQAEVDLNIRVKDEKMGHYVTGITSFNGKLATDFRETNICDVCENTIMLTLAETGKRGARVTHRTELTDEVLAIARSHIGVSKAAIARITEVAEQLAETPITREETMTIVHWLTDPKWFKKRQEENGSAALKAILDASDSRVVVDGLLNAANKVSGAVTSLLPDAPGVNDISRVGASILDSIINGPGSDLDARTNTAWGVLSGVTHHVDHKAGRNKDTALYSAMFGVGNNLKQSALDLLQVVSVAKSAA